MGTRRRAAYHEAAHAYAAYQLGVRVGELVIDDEQPRAVILWERRIQPWQLLARAAVRVASTAGEQLYEQLYEGQVTLDHASDYWVYVSAHPHLEVQTQAAEEATMELLQDERHRRALIAIAEHLYHYGHLSGEQVRELAAR